jgi:hypothetical protein
MRRRRLIREQMSLLIKKLKKRNFKLLDKMMKKVKKKNLNIVKKKKSLYIFMIDNIIIKIL